jgi:Toprim domain-containing protein/uncharacterized protein DUF3991
MPSRPDELEDFKTSINLTEYAASLGYELDRRASSRSSAVMRHTDGDKVVIARGHDGHWMYFSVRDPGDSGTVIDFCQRRRGGTLGQVRQMLRPWASEAPPLPRPEIGAFVPSLLPITRDIAAVQAAYEATRPIEGHHDYLVEARGIPQALLAEDRFKYRVRTDERSNAIFPHFNQNGLCGFEIKNTHFTGFSKQGTKGLWASSITRDDDTLVIAETAIDALSIAAIDGIEGRRFVSTAGQMNPDQPALLRLAMERLPKGGRVVLALDNDGGGDDLARRITDIYAETGRIDLELADERPKLRGTDWNDTLRSSADHPTRRSEPGFE